MRQENYYLTFFLLALFSCSGQPKWTSYSDDKGLFKTEFNRKPAVKTETQQFPFGNVTWTIASVGKPDKYNLGYLVKYADFPENVITSDSLRRLQEFFIFIQGDLTLALGEAGLDDLKLKQIQQYPGREFRWIDKPGSLGYTRRTFLVKNRLYFLEVKYKLENDFNGDIEGFLDKFSLLKINDNTNPEITAEKPIKKFEATFPGKTLVKENPIFDPTFGNIYGMLEGYEIPKDQRDLPATENIMYGVNYAKLPADKLKTLTSAEVKDFVRRAFTENIEKQTNSEILWEKDISLDGNWGFEAQGTVINGMAVLHLRAYVVGDYYYQVIVLSKLGKQNNRQALDFLNSFKVNEK